MNKDLISQYFHEYLTEKKALKLISYQLFEEFGKSSIAVKIYEGQDIIDFEGSGVGLVDAGFNAFLNHYADRYKSLSTISLTDLYFKVDHKKSKGPDLKSKTLMKIEFSNDDKNKTCFSEKTTSMGFTGIGVLAKSFEFYINCELLFKRMKFLIEDAESRNRFDVSSKYKYVLSKVVEVTNYQNIS